MQRPKPNFDVSDCLNDGLTQRRHDLELLRIVALIILIFYHTGMLYVSGWDFHFKSDYQSETLANWMLLVNPWRMSLLWFISGVALRHALHKYGSWISLRQRCVRLLLPLLFGVLVVVPPQLYVEMAGKAQLPSGLTYLEFYRAFWQWNHPLFADYSSGILPHMDVNHLWYLRELWKFSLLLIVLHFAWNKLSSMFPAAVSAIETRMGLAVDGARLSALLILALVALDVAHLDDRNMTGLLFLLAGYFLASAAAFWQHIFQARRQYLIGAAVLYVLLLCMYNLVWLVPTRKEQAWVDPSAAIIYRLYAGCCIMAVLGYARSFGERFQAFSQRWSEAVLPIYILHQSLIVVAAYVLKPYAFGAVLEPMLVIVLTVAGSYVAYLVIARFNVLRVCFGLKWTVVSAEAGEQAGLGWRIRQGLAYLVLVPLAIKLVL
jgi:peptidoglycan/LPS O-acetylase OafA/YrhL